MALVLLHVTLCSLLEKRKDFGRDVRLIVVQTGAVGGKQFACYTLCSLLSSLKFQCLLFIFLPLS